MSEEVTYVYGLFHDGRCVYVGQTRNPHQRASSHKKRFTDLLGVEPIFKVLREVARADASAAEREVIKYYRDLQQADYNIHPIGNGERKRPIWIAAETHKKLKVLSALEGRSISAICEECLELGVDFGLADHGFEAVAR